MLLLLVPRLVQSPIQTPFSHVSLHLRTRQSWRSGDLDAEISFGYGTHLWDVPVSLYLKINGRVSIPTWSVIPLIYIKTSPSPSDPPCRFHDLSDNDFSHQAIDFATLSPYLHDNSNDEVLGMGWDRTACSRLRSHHRPRYRHRNCLSYRNCYDH